jgi:predicted house-cleaning noncanonical NTP pyrophosphatase (MazG superfamily)
MKNTYLLNIQGTSFAIRSEESEEYIRSLEKKVSDMIVEITNKGASGHKAALFVCMELIDRLEKLSSKETPKHKKQEKKDLIPYSPDKNQLSLF